MEQQQLLNELNTLLKPELYQDYCPNGLQVAGKKNINRIVTGVTACEALIDAAIEEESMDAIIVHHGYFWKGEAAEIIGMKHARIKKLLANDINLFAYHLPLDGHDKLGNNYQLGHLLGFKEIKAIATITTPPIVFCSHLTKAVTSDVLSELLEEKLQRKPLHIAGTDKVISRLAWCTGAGQDFISDVAAMGFDAYISGEISERTVHAARELGIHYFAAGHHATERYGIEALGNYLASKFKLQHQFIDIDNPV